MVLWARGANSVEDLTSCEGTLMMWDTPSKARSHSRVKASEGNSKQAKQLAGSNNGQVEHKEDCRQGRDNTKELTVGLLCRLGKYYYCWVEGYSTQPAYIHVVAAY